MKVVPGAQNDVVAEPGGVSGGTDGRTKRRNRNMDAVREATVGLLRDGTEPTLALIADRAGVAVRSVYRYFGGVDDAVLAAVVEQRRRANVVLENEPDIDPSASLDERIALLVASRVRIDCLLEPLDGRSRGDDTLPAMLDSHVRAAFAFELSAAPSDEQLAGVLCGLLRLGTVRSMRQVHDDDDEQVAMAMTRTITAVLADRRPPGQNVSPETFSGI